MNMPPQVARYPAPSAQDYTESSLVLPPFETVPVPRRIERPTPLPVRSFRDSTQSTPLAPPHRVYPIEAHGNTPPTLVRAHSSGHSYTRDYGDPAEHMLRRKTPNGTLAAGYDGTPVQWAGKAPPLKHVVLPLKAETGSQNQHAQRYDGSVHGAAPTSNGWSDIGMGNQSSSRDMRMSGEPGNWSQFHQPLETSMNNINWNNIQIGPNTPYLFNNGLQIPTVNQPSYQMAPGPTISNDGGLYGPYWPDGRFVPYRPAAYRGHDMHQPDHSFLASGSNQIYRAPSEMLPPFPPTVYRSGVDSEPRDSHLPFMTDNRHYFMEGRYATPLQSNIHHITAESYSPYGDGSKTPTAASSDRSNSNPHFKEKTLSWAHTIYVDLLTYIHQSKRDNRNARPYGGRTHSKNNIYPKPPRQPSSSLTNSPYTHPYEASSRPPVPRSHSYSSSTHEVRESRNSFESQHHRSSISDTPHYVPAFLTSSAHPGNPIGKAQEALEMLTNLCEQSNWTWIDGILLGGCLAYGLDEHHKALDWYSKVIALDPRYVISQLSLQVLQILTASLDMWKLCQILLLHYFALTGAKKPSSIGCKLSS